MKLINTYQILIKKSKFIAYYYQIDNKEEIIKILEELKKEHKNSSHIPYAYKINNLIKKSDDKEPSGSGGIPIYNIIIQNNLNNTLIAVVRYFGKIKLGIGLLTRTYLKCAKEVIKI